MKQLTETLFIFEKPTYVEDIFLDDQTADGNQGVHFKFSIQEPRCNNRIFIDFKVGSNLFDISDKNKEMMSVIRSKSNVPVSLVSYGGVESFEILFRDDTFIRRYP